MIQMGPMMMLTELQFPMKGLALGESAKLIRDQINDTETWVRDYEKLMLL
jgi:hypothetical protein